MILSPQQDAALLAVKRWHGARNQQVFRCFGYAGTGKTTLARRFAEDVVGEVAFAAFTGKAAHVMRGKGCRDASTIHNLIYRLKNKDDDGKLEFELDRDSRARRARLIVIDECSMVNEAIGRDLLAFGVPILVLGDPAQLPPMEGSGYFINAKPDAMLTEIHRQARDNPIIQMATTVREGGRLEVGDYGDSKVIPSTSEYDADQVLVGRNRSRRFINSGLRTRLGLFGSLPMKSDKLVCLRNNYKLGLLNGSTWTVTEPIETFDDGEILMRLVGEEDNHVAALTHARLFEGRNSEMKDEERRQYGEFDFGYALTVHKAQGSQWDSVVLFDQSGSFREDHARWLYTGITRAAKQITVMR